MILMFAKRECMLLHGLCHLYRLTQETTQKGV